MKGKKQKIRRSQFVTVYGPGSIIESPNGSRLIPSFNGLGEENCNDAFFSKYEIKDVRMSRMLNKKNNKNVDYHLLSIPSNDSIDEDEPRVIYSTVMFPSWHLCYKRNPPILYYHYIDSNKCSAYDEKECEYCDINNNPNVRFVQACPNGHLDEVLWPKEVHGDKECDTLHYYWKSKGSSLEDIVIECPTCGLSTTMQDIYKKNKKCTGRFPEQEELKGNGNIKYTDIERSYDCEESMSVIQKQSSSLRLPYTRTLLKIPKFDDSVLNLFNNSNFNSYLMALVAIDSNLLSEEKILNDAFDILNNDEYWHFEEYLENNDISTLFDEYNKVNQRDASFESSVDEEFKAIRYGKRVSENYSRSEFIQYNLDGLNFELSFPLDICAIEKLTTVTAQISYQRNPHPKKDKKTGEIADSELIPIGYLDKNVKPSKVWYPAYKGVGEGIFITSDENPFDYSNVDDTIELWKKFNNNSDERDEVNNPLFVWWHTLSHALIKSLSLSCGYSSASLPERVYLDESSEKGGILIYNTSPGDDSGMGGLVDLVFNEIEFKKVLKNAINTLLVCSNDPLCSSVKLESGRVNGSACHNCLLISETSCEHQNTLLDRHFFIN